MTQSQLLANATHAGATTLPLDEEGVPEGGGRFALRATIVRKFYAGRLFSKVFVPCGATPIESIVFVFDNRNPRGVTFATLRVTIAKQWPLSSLRDN